MRRKFLLKTKLPHNCNCGPIWLNFGLSDLELNGINTADDTSGRQTTMRWPGLERQRRKSDRPSVTPACWYKMYQPSFIQTSFLFQLYFLKTTAHFYPCRPGSHPLLSSLLGFILTPLGEEISTTYFNSLIVHYFILFFCLNKIK